MATTLYAIPSTFPAGNTVTYRRSFTDYPVVDGWSLTLYLAGASVQSVLATTDGSEFVVTITPAHTAMPFIAGHYTWVERVSLSGEIHDVAAGVVAISPDLATATAGSEQSWLEATVTVLKAHIANRLPAGMESYQIGGRGVVKIPLREAISMLVELEAQLDALANPDIVSRSVLVSFTEP